MVTLSTCTCSYCTMHAVWSMHACQHGVVDMHAYCGIVYADSAKFLGQGGCESAAGCHQAFCGSHTAAAAKCSHHRMLPHSQRTLHSCLRDSVATSTAWHPRACHCERTYAVGVTMCHDVCYVMGPPCWACMQSDCTRSEAGVLPNSVAYLPAFGRSWSYTASAAPLAASHVCSSPTVTLQDKARKCKLLGTIIASSTKSRKCGCYGVGVPDLGPL